MLCFLIQYDISLSHMPTTSSKLNSAMIGYKA